MTSDADPPTALPVPHRNRTASTVLRIGLAGVAVGGIALYLHYRSKPAASATAGSGSGGGSGAGGAAGADARVVPVQVIKPERKDLPIWLEGLGTVAAVQQVTVHTQVDGRLDKVLFTEGKVVKRGELLAQIDPRPYMVMLHQAQGQLARDRAQQKNAETTLARDKDLHTQNLIAQATVDLDIAAVGQAAGSVQIDQSAIENAQLQLDYAAVKSPVDGVTGIRLVDAGNIVHAADATGLVVVTAIDEAALFFSVPQDRLDAIALAQSHGDVEVEAWSRDGTAKIATGKLAVLDNQINQTTATLRLKALIPNLKHELWPNAFVKARMLLETRKNALVVPTVAVQQGPQQGAAGQFVYIINSEQKAVMKPVTVSLTTGDLSIIDTGLDGTEDVVIEGQNQLRPGGKASVGGKPGAPDAKSGASGGSGGGSGSGGHHPGSGAGGGGSANPGGAAVGSASAPPPAAKPTL